MSSTGVKATGGKLPLINGAIPPGIVFAANANVILTQCTTTDAPTNDIQVATQIGCSVVDHYFDSGNTPGGVPAQLVANNHQRVSAAPYTTGFPAFALAYNGSGTTATFDILGTAGGTTRQLVLEVDGSAVLTLTALGMPLSGIYTMQDAVSAINASGTGFTATPQPNATWNDIRFAQVGVALTITPSTASANNPLTVVLVGAFDLHCDSFQMAQHLSHDNELMYGVYSYDCRSQPFFWNVGTTGEPASIHNCAIINCCLSNVGGANASSGLFGVWSVNGGSHLLMAHVLLPNNMFRPRLDFAYESVDTLSRVLTSVLDIVDSRRIGLAAWSFSAGVSKNVILTIMSNVLVPGFRSIGAVELGVANTVEFPALSASSLGKVGFTPRRGSASWRI